MSQIEILARQAWQLHQQGYDVEEIADAMGRPTSSVERWLINWEEMSERLSPWHEGLELSTVSSLKRAGIDSGEALLAAWERGEIQRGSPQGIGVARLIEIRSWVEAKGSSVEPALPKAFIVDLMPEAEAALTRLRYSRHRGISQLINDLLIEADRAAHSE